MAFQKDENSVHLRGRAGKDAETRMAGTKSVTKFSLATSWSKDKAEWHNIEAWGSEEAAGVKKGDRIELWGYLKTNSWEKDGRKNYMTVIVANKFVFEAAPLTPARPKSDLITDDDIDSVPF